MFLHMFRTAVEVYMFEGARAAMCVSETDSPFGLG